jgi:hypothetical protein
MKKGNVYRLSLLERLFCYVIFVDGPVSAYVIVRGSIYVSRGLNPFRAVPDISRLKPSVSLE